MSINSEGYFSSEDDTKRKVDRLSQKLQELGQYLILIIIKITY